MKPIKFAMSISKIQKNKSGNLPFNVSPSFGYTVKALLDSSVRISNWINEVVGLVRTKLLYSVYLTAQYSKSIPVSGKESNTFARLYEAIFKIVL